MRSLPLVSALFLLAVACGSGSTAPASTIPTVLVIEPDRFLGTVPCLDTPGGARRYVATLEDVSPNLFGGDAAVTSFTLPSSAPTSCHDRVAFGLVTPGHEYVADIQTYDRSDLTPAAPGSAVMLDPSGNPVEPRWVTACGRDPLSTGQGPTICAANMLRTVVGCLPLGNAPAPDQTIVTIVPRTALGNLSCGPAAGEIARWIVVPDDSTLAQQSGESCDAELSFAGLESGRGYTFDLFGFEAGATLPRWGATCLANASAGVTVVATCDTLSDRGSLSVDVAGWLDSAGQLCGAPQVTEVTVRAFTPDGVLVQVARAPGCGPSVTFTGLLPGAYPLEVSATTSTGAEVGSQCEAVVKPGTTAVAVCDPVGA